MSYVLNDNLYPGADYRVTFPRVTGAQVVTLTGATGGTFTLAYRGATTGALAYNASAATVQTALEALSTITAGQVSVSGSAGGPYTVTPLGNNSSGLDPAVFILNKLVVGLGSITPTTATAGVTLQPLNTTGFTYSLQARSHPPDPTTPDIQIDATHTSQGSFTNGGATGLITLRILGSAIESLNFNNNGSTNSTALYDILENDGTNVNLFVRGVYSLQPRVYQ